MLTNLSPSELAEMLNGHLGGFNRLIDLRFTSVTREQLVAELTLGPQHTQAHGIVHGGVYASIIETLCSAGAATHVLESGRTVVGLDNHTSFHRAVREGVVTAKASPLKTGRRSHVWRGEVFDEQQRLLASGQVRLLVLESAEGLGTG